MKHSDKTNYTERIQLYFSGKLSDQEKFELEKEALDDPFLQDAMDGFSANQDAIAYFDSHLKRKNNRWKSYFGLGVVTVLVIALLIVNYQKNDPPVQNTESTNELISEQPETTEQPIVQKEIEMIPDSIEKLHVIDQKDRIVSQVLASDFSSNEVYPDNPQQEPIDENILINIDTLDIEEHEPEMIVNNNSTTKDYPYVYYYDLAVVDYRRYENRTKTISKITYELSGLSAANESEEKKNETHMVEKVVKISYMDYLEETIYYFSKDKYKSALKRLNVISKQYNNDLNAFFYGGLCYYNLGDFETALSKFNLITKLGDVPFKEEASWYKVKTLLKLNQVEEAKKLLTDIIAYKGFYADEAMALLKSLP